MDRIADFLADLPIGLIIFIIAMAFGMFGKDDKKQPQDARAPRQQATPPEQPVAPSIFASDDRRAREERAMREQQREVITFGGLEFGSSDALFRDDEDDRPRDTKFGFDKSEWGQTKYGFEESEWGSSFGDKKNPDPIIR